VESQRYTGGAIHQIFDRSKRRVDDEQLSRS
jgi:hypothetical protein